MPELFPGNAELLTEVRDSFRTAERYIKSVPTVWGDNSGVGLPAINELRYAGEHLLEAFHQSEEDQFKNLRKALNHCHRASYDAVEAGCMAIIEQIQEFYEETRGIIVTDDIPDYINKKTQIRTIRQFIVDHSREDAEAYWEALEKHFHRLNELFIEFDEARPEINKRKAISDRVEDTQYGIARTSALIGLLGVVIGAVLMIIFG